MPMKLRDILEEAAEALGVAVDPRGATWDQIKRLPYKGSGMGRPGAAGTDAGRPGGAEPGLGRTGEAGTDAGRPGGAEPGWGHPGEADTDAGHPGGASSGWEIPGAAGTDAGRPGGAGAGARGADESKWQPGARARRQWGVELARAPDMSLDAELARDAIVLSEIIGPPVSKRRGRR